MELNAGAVQKLFEKYDLPEAAERDLETGTYTNLQMAEMLEGDLGRLEALLQKLPGGSHASRRSILSFAIEMDPIVKLQNGETITFIEFLSCAHRPSVQAVMQAMKDSAIAPDYLDEKARKVYEALKSGKVTAP